MEIDSLRIARFCELTGWTKSAVQNKIQKGDWIVGREYSRAPDGSIVVSIQGYEGWINQSKTKVPASFRHKNL